MRDRYNNKILGKIIPSMFSKKVVLLVTTFFVMFTIFNIQEIKKVIKNSSESVTEELEEESNNIKTINLGIKGISNPESPISLMSYWSNGNGHYVYFGNYYNQNSINKEPIKWRVLNIGNNSDYSNSAQIDSMLLLSDQVIDNVYFNKDFEEFNGEYYKSEKNAVEKFLYNDYKNSEIRTWLNSTFINSAFNELEQRVLKNTNKMAIYENNINHSALEGDRVFLLSAMEANASIYGFAVGEDITKYNVSRKLSSTPYVQATNSLNKSIWQLRSVYTDRSDVTSMVSDGGIDYIGVASRYTGVAPSMNIDTNAIMFTTKEGLDKKDILGSTRSVSGGTAWNITLQEGEGFKAIIENKVASMVRAGDNIEAIIQQIPTGTNIKYNQISAMIVDKNETVVAYGQIADKVVTGKVEIMIPYDIKDGEYTLKLFAEEVNSSETKNAIDFISNMENISISIISGIGDIEDKLKEEHSLYHNVKATLYDNELYAEGGKGVELTEQGINVTGWDYQSSKFLQIDVSLHATSKDIHVVEVELPKEMYFLGQFTTPPAGFKEVVFTKNKDFRVNGDARDYNVNSLSGTAKFYLDAEVTRATIQLELRYDRTLWDKTSNTSITADGIIPIKVSMNYEAEKGIDLIGGELKNVKVNKVYSGAGKGRGLHINESTTKYNLAVRNAKDISYNIIEDKQVSENFYLEEAIYEIKVPSAVDDKGTRHYLKYKLDEVVINKGCFHNAVNYEIIQSDKDVIRIRVNKAYFRVNHIITVTYECPTGIVSNKATMTFSGGGLNIYGKSINGKDLTMMTSSNSTTMPIKLDENVSASSSSGKGVYLDTSRDGVTMAGGLYFSNTGALDSEPKKISMRFPDKLLVTTNNLHVASSDKTIQIEYTLKDDNGKQVYLDGNGNRVNESNNNAKSTWTVIIQNRCYGYTSIDNLYTTFTRNDLPEAHRKYFFKSIKYTVATMKAQAKLYAYSANYSPGGAGNYFGYLTTDTKVGEYLYTYIEITGVNKNNINPFSISTSIQGSATPSYGINNVNFSKSEITAGEDVDVNGYLFTTSYPYGSAQRLKNIVFGILVPSGVTIDKDNIVMRYGSNTGEKLDIDKVSSVVVDKSQTLWTIKLDPEAVIGYYNEKLSNISTSYRIYFNISLTTNSKMNLQTLFSDTMLYATGLNSSNSSGGAYAWASGVDKYDINENGSKTDRIGIMDYTLSKKCIVNPKPPSLDIDDYIQISGKGSVEGKDAHIADIEDEVIYNLNIKCIDEGSATEFEYYIPIPKVDSGRDEYLVIGDRDLAFDMNMIQEPTILGDQLYYIEYAVSSSLTLTSARKLSESRWYTIEELEKNDKTLKDVTMLRIKAKNNDAIKVGDNTTVKVKLKADKSKNAVYKDLRNRWKSSGYYNFETENAKISGYFRSSGCNADISFASADVEKVVLVGTINSTNGILKVENTFPKQINNMKKYKQGQTYTLTEIETTNVTLISVEDMINNQNTMSEEDSNEKLAFDITLINNNGNGIGNNTDNIIDLYDGTGQTLEKDNNGTIPHFIISMYYGRNFTDLNKNRSINFTLEGDKGVTLKIQVEISFEEINYISVTNGETYYHEVLDQDMKLFYTYDVFDSKIEGAEGNLVTKNEPITFKVVKARNSEKVDFALSTYKNFYYTNYYVDNKYITILDENGNKVEPKKVFKYGDKNIAINVVTHNGGSDGNTYNIEDLYSEWEEWRKNNPWIDSTQWYNWGKIKQYVQNTNVYSLEGNKEYKIYIADEYINKMIEGGDILYLHSSLPRIRTTIPIFIMRRTVFEMR